MVGKTKTPTRQERDHMETVQRLGCLACRIESGDRPPAEIHHVTDAGQRMGHRYVLPLCPHHHRSVSETGMRPSEAEAIYGPSLAQDKAGFTRHYGTEAELLRWVESLVGRETA
jgi:hypothetical protein